MTEEAPAQPAQPRLGMLSQFVRTLNFDNVAAKANRSPKGRPKIDVQVNCDNQSLGEDRYVVSLTLTIKAVLEETDDALFTMALDYAGVVHLTDTPEDMVQPYLNIEAPRLLFPFARRIISDTSRDGGFLPLNLDPINFGQVYARDMAAARAAN